MPGLKMRTKSRTKCARERSLHACRKSNKSFEELRLQAKTCQQASALDTSVQLLDDVSSDVGRSDEDILDAEASDHEIILAGNSAQLMKFPLQSSDSAGTEDLVSVSVTFTPLLETIFSPACEHNESKFKLVNDNSAVKAGEHPDLPQLVCVDSNDERWSLNDAHSCKFWDLYTSEGAASFFDSDIGFYNVMNSACQTYDYMESDLIYEKEDKCMLLSSPEKNVEIGIIYDEKPGDGKTSEALVSSDDSCLYFAIHQMTKPETGMCYKNSDLEELECNDPQLFLRTLPDLSEASCPSVLPQETRKSKPITLVLDLDETLVHSTLEHCDDADFTFPIFFNMKQHTVYVRRRPHLQTFLERVARMFEIVIFTASQSIYAEQLLDILDPDRKLFSQRMYRESCIFSDGNYTKDLTILGVDLAKVAIIDNTPQVFRLQVNNGIPIMSWFDDPSDQQLIALLPFLETLVDADDVRPIIAKRFGNKE